jgi:argininosuccinate lyase
MAADMLIRNQVNVRVKKTQQTQRTILWLRHAHALSQQILQFRECFFIVATTMPICNQQNICGNKDTSNVTNEFRVATRI